LDLAQTFFARTIIATQRFDRVLRNCAGWPTTAIDDEFYKSALPTYQTAGFKHSRCPEYIPYGDIS